MVREAARLLLLQASALNVNYFEGQKTDLGYHACFLRVRGQGRGQTTTGITKLSLEMSQYAYERVTVERFSL